MNQGEKLAYLAGVNVYPFLIIKKERCEIAIKFRKTFEKRERNLSKETFELRLILFNQMRHLNHRGS